MPQDGDQVQLDIAADIEEVELVDRNVNILGQRSESCRWLLRTPQLNHHHILKLM